jgi:SAM-dependent methyltransferase
MPQGAIVTMKEGIFLTKSYRSETAVAIWKQYVDIFYDMWGIDESSLSLIGHAGGKITNIEYAERGEKHYSDSVVVPIRNTLYSCHQLDSRWGKLKNRILTQPILDYGCGVGATLELFRWNGYKDVYGYEVEGVQKRVLERTGIPVWDKATPSRFGTVVCTNVLEHLPNPTETLDYLRTLSDNLIANCAMSDQPDHIAPVKEREAINNSLVERGEHIDVL